MNQPVAPPSASERFWIGAFVVVPFLACLAGAIHALRHGVDLVSLALCFAFYMVSTLGITVGFHRLFTHGSFTVRKPWLERLLAICGSTAAEGSVFTWVGWHRKHHNETDTPDDPHSPYRYGTGGWSLFRGFIHAHTTWLFRTAQPDPKLVGKKLLENPRLAAIDRQFKIWLVAGLLLPPLIGAALRRSFAHVTADFVWGGLIRLFLAHHVTWSVNSVCHIWGKRPFQTDDRSTNNWLVAILASGEGWHHNHHVFPSSAKQGLLPWQLDLSWWIIRGFEKLGWVEKVLVPSPEQVQAKLIPARAPLT